MSKQDWKKLFKEKSLEEQVKIAKAAKAKAVMITDSPQSSYSSIKGSELYPPDIRAWRYWRQKKAEERQGAALVNKIKEFTKKINTSKESSAKTSMRFGNKRAFLLNYLNKGEPPNIASVWQYIHNNAGKENFQFKSVSKATATMMDGETVERKHLSRQLKRLVEKIKK